ncbi:Polyadenylate-binding protein-interacting protein 12 [Coccomyxa sp. Obi]|nr:Polyadenylate-binding protein-interacting protein 12 [Coccomyxa sp. Obi]
MWLVWQDSVVKRVSNEVAFPSRELHQGIDFSSAIPNVRGSWQGGVKASTRTPVSWCLDSFLRTGSQQVFVDQVGQCAKLVDWCTVIPGNQQGVMSLRGHSERKPEEPHAHRPYHASSADEYLTATMERLRLDPMAKEFVPPVEGYFKSWQSFPSQNQNAFGSISQSGNTQYPSRYHPRPRRKNALQKQFGGNVRRTIYICDVDQQVTEASLADVFKDSGRIVDCRVCGDPNAAMRFAFIEFAEEAAVQQAIKLNGVMLGKCPIRVMPSKTAIVPVNRSFLPRTQEELARCARTVYIANIDKEVDREDVRLFFQRMCGPVTQIRLLSDYNHISSIAFVEFASFDSAKKALDCSGALLGRLPMRVTPSKAPVRDQY